ncbi:MAG: hypothetical protein HZB53_10485 [Chloroflexi bacterium]|nr:hypothetical protein [Chloroflexota bacterium]
MIPIDVTDAWRQAHPGAIIGLLEIAGAVISGPCPVLNERKRAIEERLRSRYRGFTRPDFLALPVMDAYVRYYKRFEKTYHVLLQVESLVLKGKNLPELSPLVDANFAAEVETLVLTAGHDAEQLIGPVCIDVSRAGDRMTPMGGAEREIRPGDMVMRDRDGIACSIIYGQDNRSPIAPQTTHALYVAYAPTGVPADAVERQLKLIAEHVRLCAPGATIEQERMISGWEEYV